LTDSDTENSETQVWLEFALACKYISEPIYQELISEGFEIVKLINYMILNPEKFGIKKEQSMNMFFMFSSYN
jgi:four helix bundle protein